MTPTLFSWQVPHVEALKKALTNHKVALDASDLGTGKTICACATARDLKMDLVVCCKKIMKPVWAYWMDQWGVSGVVGNWEMARRRGLPALGKTLYVFDEVHEASGYKTLNAKLLVNTYEARFPILMCSATAIESPLKMWALGYLLGFHNLKDFYQWGFKNGIVKNFGFPGHHFNGSATVLNRIHTHVFPEWGARMRRALIPEFPECSTTLELVEVPENPLPGLNAYFRRVTEREKAHEDKMEDAETPFATDNDLTRILYLRMRAELSKVPVLIEETKEALEEGMSVVIFVNFIDTLHALNSIGFPHAGLIYGEQKIAARTGTIEAFQSDRSRVIIATIDSGGASINLHDLTGKHPRLALICPTWRATTLRQTLGRVHRAGARTKALQKLLYAAGTIEEEVATRVRAKLDQIDTINDSDLAEADFAAV
jgi:hypothetical protein